MSGHSVLCGLEGNCSFSRAPWGCCFSYKLAFPSLQPFLLGKLCHLHHLLPHPSLFLPFLSFSEVTKSCWQRCEGAGASCKHSMIFPSISPAPQQFPGKAFCCLKPRADICTVTSSEASEQLWLLYAQFSRKVCIF